MAYYLHQLSQQTLWTTDYFTSLYVSDVSVRQSSWHYNGDDSDDTPRPTVASVYLLLNGRTSAKVSYYFYRSLKNSHDVEEYYVIGVFFGRPGLRLTLFIGAVFSCILVLFASSNNWVLRDGPHGRPIFRFLTSTGPIGTQTCLVSNNWVLRDGPHGRPIFRFLTSTDTIGTQTCLVSNNWVLYDSPHVTHLNSFGRPRFLLNACGAGVVEVEQIWNWYHQKNWNSH